MKIYKLIPLLLLICTNAYAVTYTATKPKDLDVTTPTEASTKISEFNNSDREIKTVITNLENITTVTGTYTVAGTQTGILGSSTAGFTISFPDASTLATGTITKRYMIKNINTGTITLNLTVDGVGSPTVTGSQSFKLFTDGTSWFEERANRAAIASNALLFNNLPDTYYTNATNIATGTVNLDRLPGTLTGKSADMVDGYHAGTSATTVLVLDGSGLVPLANIPTTLTGKDADSVDSIDGTNIVQTSRTISTTAPLAGGGALSSNLTLSMPLATSGQNGYISSADWTTFNNKVSSSVTINTTAPITGGGDLSASRTLSMATATASVPGYLGTPDFNAFNNKANVVAGSGITSSSTTGTTTITNNGVLQILAGTGISVSSNGTGTPTITASGTATAGGWTDTGTSTVATAGYPVIVHGTLTVDTAYGVTGLLDRDIPDNVTLTNLTQITTRNYDDISGTSTIKPTQIAIGTSTLQGALNAVGSATFSGTVTAGGFSGSGAGLTSLPPSSTAWSDLTGNPGDNGSVTTNSTANTVALRNENGFLGMNGIVLSGTTTAITGTSSSARIYNLIQTKTVLSLDANVKALLLFNNPGESTFLDSSASNLTFTNIGSPIGTTTAKFGTGALHIENGASEEAITTGTNTALSYSGDFTDEFWVNYLIKPTTNPFRYFIETGATPLRYTQNGDNTLVFQNDVDTVFTFTFNPTVSSWYHLAIQREGNTWRAWYGTQSGSSGVQLGTATYSTAISIDGAFKFFRTNAESQSVLIDEYRHSNIARYVNGAYVTPTSLESVSYLYNSCQFIPAGTTTVFLSIIDNGTYSATKQLVVGSSTPSSTDTVYVGDFIGKVYASGGFYSPSEERLKVVYDDEGTKTNYLDQLEKLRTGKWSWIANNVNRLDAEAKAKTNFLNREKSTWITANQSNYTKEVFEAGTGTVTKVDKITMEKDYKNYIELEWAGHPKQFEMVNEVENNLKTGENAERHIGAFAGNPTTPDILQNKEKTTLSLNDTIGWTIEVQKDMLKMLKAQQKEIDNLKKLVSP